MTQCPPDYDFVPGVDSNPYVLEKPEFHQLPFKNPYFFSMSDLKNAI